MSLLTDFGLRDPYVGIMKGAVLRAFAKAVLVDLVHDLPPYDVEAGALFLQAAIGRFPVGTVHVAVVDPGVGTDRRILAACAADAYWIGPDNGVLEGVIAQPDGAEVRVVDWRAMGLVADSRTFHGRDLFGPIAGMLARGQVGFRALGPPIDDPVRGARGAPRVVLVDRFGNLITNVRADRQDGVPVAVGIAGREVEVRDTYGDAAPGTLLALVNSYGLLEIAVAGGSASERLGVGRDEPVQLTERTKG